jgi:hypothetical protein
MVIGLTKSELIRDEPLLTWYFDVFKEVLNMPQRKLIVIGYSFRDKHINGVIMEAIRKSRLKVYVVSPQTQEQFQNDLLPIHSVNVKEKPFSAEILDSLEGYYGGSVTDLYNASTQQLSAAGRRFFRNARVI